LKNNLLQFKQIPAFADNYLWVITLNQLAWVIDPGDASPLINYFEQENIQLKGILITHHHNDHIGGLKSLQDWAKQKGNLSVQTFGPNHPMIQPIDRSLQGGDTVEIFLGETLQVLSVPGHTLSHIAYFLPESAHNPTPRLYCGDTLFAGGCGRLFEGTPEQMHQSLKQFAELPNETLVCCAHEYTLSNLKFAKYIDSDNQDLVKWSLKAEQLRMNNQPTVPTTIGLEKRVNPFMRCDQGSIIQAAKHGSNSGVNTPSEVLAAIRKMKDSF
jgi:hydroxyacylglutathione hydrolase